MSSQPVETPMLMNENSEAQAEEVDTGKESYCYSCEDGGQVIECSICSKVFCYSKMGEPRSKSNPPCVTVPGAMADEALGLDFPCPDCLAVAQARCAPYIINQGARSTMRLTTRTSLVVVILCLDSHEKLSIAIEQQIQAILGVFEVNVATCCHQIGAGVSAEDEEALLAQLIEGAHFHLAVVFVTESNPGGGWFTKSGKASVQVGEANFLGWMNNQVRGLSARALSVRYFGICCGWNLQGEGVMSEIEAALRLTGVLSFVVPTVCSALPSDFAFMLSEIFISLYYFGADLLPTLYKVWGRSEEARYHTGLLNVERKKKEEPFSVTRLFYAPRDRRPLGVDLPVASTICGCRSDTPEHRTWDYVRDRHNEGGELVFICESVCCKTLLYVAIFHRRRRSVKRHDLVFVEEDWESSTRKFLFNDSTMVRMKVFPPGTSDETVFTPQGPWTVAGKGAVLMQSAVQPDGEGVSST